MAAFKEGQQPVLGSLSMQLSLPTAKQHTEPVEAQESDVVAVLAYHDALAQHLGSLLGAAASGTARADTATTEAAMVIPSSSETVASDRKTSVADASAALPQMEATPAAVQAAPPSEKAAMAAHQPPEAQPAQPPRQYTNLELLAQRDAEHRRAWFLIGHSKYVGGVQDGFQLKMAPAVSLEAQPAATPAFLGSEDSLIARRRKRKMLEAGGSAASSPSESSPRKRPRTMESAGTAHPGQTLQQRRRVSHGDKDMKLSFASPVATVIPSEPLKLSAVPLLERARKHSNRPKHIALPPAWTTAVATPNASVAISAVNATAVAQPVQAAPVPAATAFVPPPLYRRPSFTLQQPPLTHRRGQSDSRIVDKPSTPAPTPGIEDTPARVAAHLGRHGSMASEGDMSGSSLASLTGASMTCRSVQAQDSGEIGAKARFAGKDGPTWKGQVQGLSLGLSPAMTPDNSGLMGILGFGMTPINSADAQESAAELDVKMPERSASASSIQPSHDDPVMLGRRIEDEWWASYVDFET